MAIVDAYATAAQYKAQTGKTSAADDTTLERQLLAVSRMVDRKLGRAAGSFNKDASAVVRLFRPATTRGVLDVDEFVSITSVELDTGYDGLYSTLLAGTAYELLPWNAADGPEANPYTQIGLYPWGSRTSWAEGERVKVTAVWGWPAVPAGIITATIELTAILRIESGRATSAINEMDQVISMSRVGQSIIAELLDTYRRLPGVA